MRTIPPSNLWRLICLHKFINLEIVQNTLNVMYLVTFLILVCVEYNEGVSIVKFSIILFWPVSHLKHKIQT